MTAAFDTLKYARSLEKAGVPKDQAEVHAEALRGVLEEQIMARFDRVENRFTQVDRELSDIKSDLRLLKWMMSFVLAVLAAVLWLVIRIAMRSL